MDFIKKVNYKKIALVLLPSFIILLLLYASSFVDVEEVAVAEKDVVSFVLVTKEKDCKECDHQLEQWSAFKKENQANGVQFKEINISSIGYTDFTNIHEVREVPSVLGFSKDGTLVHVGSGVQDMTQLKNGLGETISQAEFKGSDLIEEEPNSSEDK